MGNFRSQFAGSRVLCFNCSSVTSEELTVETKYGKVRGKEFRSVLSHKNFFSFLGIPFAKPPVGDLRFQPPQPPDPWDGVFNAAVEKQNCLQIDFMFRALIIGSEDCLYLNVHTPELPCKITSPKPVMVFIHGGGFCMGSGSMKVYSADYLINHDVILVTINYRLHVLGFLNLGIPSCPGNVGLKDQVLALKWVQENISSFGGDPNNVTIFGESAGASSVHFHTVSPLSKGLFHKAIMQSGSALSPWAMTFNPREQAFKIGKLCGYTGHDAKQLVEHLKKVPGKYLTRMAVECIKQNRELHPARISNMSPSVETIAEGAFLPDSPDNLMKVVDPVPSIFGVNDKEGMLLLIEMSKHLVEKLEDDFSVVLKHNFKIKPNLLPSLGAQVRQYYFGDESIKDNMQSLFDLYTDIYFYRAHEVIDFLAKPGNPVFVYEFSYDGALNFFRKLANFNKKTKHGGASHADELFYLFHPRVIPFHPKLEGECVTVIQNLTLMWTNFAKTGDPSPGIQWRRSTEDEPSYLSISNDLKMVDGKIYGERMKAFKSLLDPVAIPFNIF